MKKRISILLVIIMILGFSTSSFAMGEDKVSLKSMDTKSEVINYAHDILPKHLAALNRNGELLGNLKDYQIGDSFTIFNVINDSKSTCFPIMYDNSIIAILETHNINGEYESSLSISFAKELEQIFINNNIKQFALITDGVSLQVFDGQDAVEIFKLYDDGNQKIDLSASIKFQLDELPKELTKSILDRNVTHILTTKGIAGPTSYKTVNVRGVSQGNHPWCWAATCAAMINYYKGKSLTAADVAKYVFPSQPYQGGNWTNMKKAYNHWGLYPSQKGIISFDSVITKIKGNKPMHLGLKGHSVGLIGYEDWRGSPDGHNEKILILLEPNGGIRKSVTVNSSGNFSYSLGGGSNAWIYTREF